MYCLDQMQNRITFENFREQQQVEDVSSDTNERLRKWNWEIARLITCENMWERVRTCERKNNNGNHNRQISIMLHVTIIGSQVAWVTSCWLTGLVTNNFILNWIEMWDKKQRVAWVTSCWLIGLVTNNFYIELTEWLFMVHFLICLCRVLCCCFNNPKILPSL